MFAQIRMRSPAFKAEKMRGILYVTVLCTCLAICPCLSEEQYSVVRLTTADGLSQSHVYDILQDSRGFMWFATRDGLNMYDGYRFTVYRHIPYDSSSPANSSIMAIEEDRDGFIWIAVGSAGVSRLDRQTREFTSYRHDKENSRSLCHSTVTCILKDSHGILWFGTEKGLCRYNSDTDDFTRVPIDSAGSLRKDPQIIRALFEDQSGTLWTIARKSLDFFFLYRFQRDTQSFVRYPLRTDAYEFIGENLDGILYFGSRLTVRNPGDTLLYSFDPRPGGSPGLKPIHIPLPQMIDQRCEIHALGIESDGTLWLRFTPLRFNTDSITTWTFRLSKTSDSTLVPIYQENASFGGVISYWRSNEGIIWIGGANGIVKLVPKYGNFSTFRHSTVEGSLSHNFIRSIHVDANSDVWVGSSLGLNRWRRSDRKWQRYFYKDYNSQRYNMFMHNAINEIYEEDDGALLLGTNTGIKLLNHKTGALEVADYLYCESSAVFESSVWALYRDSAGILWAGTHHNGISLFNRQGQCIARITEDDPDAGEYTGGMVWDIFCDSYGDMWIATSSGLNRRIPGTRSFVSYKPNPDLKGSVSGSNICALYEDRERTLWVVAHGAGINRYNRASDSFESLTTHNGLPDDAIYSIIQDQSGAYWLSANSGLIRYDREEDRFRTYTHRDGLQSNEFSFKAYCAAPDGTLYFGGINGLNAFNPTELRDNPHEPRIVITACNVFDTLWRPEVKNGDTLELDYAQNFISFEFAALDFVNPVQNQYAYKLEGFHEQWVYCGTRRQAEFTNLDPGNYVFRVKGSNNNGLWNETGAAVTLSIVPPFWMTVWFRVGSIGSGITLIALFVVVRVRSAMGRNLLKRRLLEYRLQSLRLQMNPHFIFNSLSSIEYLIMQKEERRASEYLTRFARLVRAILDHARSATLTIAEDLANLKVYLELESLRFDHAFDYEIRIDPSLDPSKERIPSMLIQPYAENALRHGMIHTIKGGFLQIVLQRSGDVVQCTIEDNGIGRKRAREHAQRNNRHRTSLGTRVSGERLELLNSTRRKDISSVITDLYDADGCPCGTRVELWIPVEATTKTNGVYEQ